MTPEEIGKLALAFAAGLALAALHFGGLWWTVRRLPKSKSPHLWTLGSFVVRLAITVAVVVLIARIHSRYALATMVGLIALRLVLVRTMRSAPLAATLDEDG